MKKYDKPLAILFGLLTFVFLILLFRNEEFLNWVFARHQNQLSWFIRPIFIIPFCYFAYRQSWAGLAVTIFALFTSMFWFNQPSTVTPEVKAFLQFETAWISGNWDLKKLLFALLVPISFAALAVAFWRRSLRIGLVVVASMAFGKLAWGIFSAGESGRAMMVPALVGLFICIAIIYYGFKRLENQ